MSSLSPSGARIRGDDYQHIFTWLQALRSLQRGSDIIAIGIEDPDAGSVDDVTVYRSRERDEFFQAKSSVDARQPVNTEWLTCLSRTGGPSVLQRFHKSWRDLTQAGRRPRMALVTNCPADPHDVVMVLRDGRDGTVANRLAEADPKKGAGMVRGEWAAHLGIDEAELLEFLKDLRFLMGKLEEEWKGDASQLMYSLGLRRDQDALRAAVATVRGWVTAGRRRLSAEEIREEVESLHIKEEEQAATLLVQALDRDPMPEIATIALDWTDLYEGEEPRSRRTLRDGRLWNERLRPEIREAVRQLRGRGYRRVLVRGYMRLPTWFTLGIELGETAGFEVISFQGGELWASGGEIAPFPVTVDLEEVLGGGPDLAVGISISADLSADVLDYLPTGVPAAGKYVSIAPVSGTSNRAIGSGAEARGCVLEIRKLVRTLVREHRPQKLHLFLATPHAAAVLLGHFWDRMPYTQLYEDQGAAGDYLPSFTIPN